MWSVQLALAEVNSSFLHVVNGMSDGVLPMASVRRGNGLKCQFPPSPIPPKKLVNGQVPSAAKG